MTATDDKSYKRKIKSIAELKKIIGPWPHKKNVIICHGTFDIVHPGHIRHLQYASEKADILIASLTCDAHITKGKLRPFVPEELRAMNLAALEMVDYVVIDPNPTPLETLKELKPNYFAKGYDYFEEVSPKTAEEIDVLESYGGEIIFTPGDVVYSSTALLESSRPRIASEKLLVLMESENVTFDDLRSTLTKFSDLKVHVIGDTIVDSLTYCTLIGGGIKTPTLSVKYEQQINFSGGAAVVAKHIKRTGAQVKFSTVLGDDALKDFVLNDLEDHGIECHFSIDKTRPTTQKNTIISDKYRMLKIDKVDNQPISDKTLKYFQKSLSSSQASIFIFSDFRHGIFNRQTIPVLVKSVHENAFKVADSQVATRWGNILDFQGFDLITPNEREARFALAEQDMVIRPLALKLYKRAKCKYLILKLGSRGIITYRRSNIPSDFRAFFTIDSFANKVIDPVGSGDALLAYATLSLVTTKSEVIASILGSVAAGVACEQDGNNPVEPSDVLDKLDSIERQLNCV